MSVLLSILFSVYTTSIISFSFVSNPIFYCLLLLLSALTSCGIIFIMLGFSWYMLLFCVVYIGGVYILFIFVTVYQPNSVLSSNISGWWLLIFYLLIFLYSLYFQFNGYHFEECSQYLCNRFEGYTYLVLCLVLVLGFSCISIIVNRKDSFYR